MGNEVYGLFALLIRQGNSTPALMFDFPLLLQEDWLSSEEYRLCGQGHKIHLICYPHYSSVYVDEHSFPAKLFDLTIM